MSCYDPHDSDDPFGNEAIEKLQKKVDNLTRMLYSIMKTYERLTLKENFDLWDIPGVRHWWDNYKNQDRQRIQEARKSGLAKLTDDEKEALGL